MNPEIFQTLTSIAEVGERLVRRGREEFGGCLSRDSEELTLARDALEKLRAAEARVFRQD